MGGEGGVRAGGWLWHPVEHGGQWGALCRLPLLLPFASGDALLFRRVLAASPRLQQLLDHLRDMVQRLALVHHEIATAAPLSTPVAQADAESE